METQQVKTKWSFYRYWNFYWWPAIYTCSNSMAFRIVFAFGHWHIEYHRWITNQ